MENSMTHAFCYLFFFFFNNKIQLLIVGILLYLLSFLEVFSDWIYCLLQIGTNILL